MTSWRKRQISREGSVAWISLRETTVRAPLKKRLLYVPVCLTTWLPLKTGYCTIIIVAYGISFQQGLSPLTRERLSITPYPIRQSLIRRRISNTNERLESLGKNMRALSLISIQEFSPSKPANISMMNLETKNLGTCNTLEREGTISYEESFVQTPSVCPTLSALPTSRLSFQQFQRKDLDLQVMFCIISYPFYSSFISITPLFLDLHLQEILKFGCT